MDEVRLKKFLRPKLDVVFIALNPPEQSNANGHYFSGKGSRFFELLTKSGLINEGISKELADETVFGTNKINYKRSSFGVVDLVPDHVQTASGKVRVKGSHVTNLIKTIRDVRPRFACLIHSKVKRALMQYGGLELGYGLCRCVLPGCSTRFVVNYFPNGNSIKDEEKIRIFRLLKNLL